jgi:hypothetical protein
MRIAGKFRGGLLPLAMMVVLSVGGFQTQAKATMIALGSYSSSSGAVHLTDSHSAGDPSIYFFALTDHAKVSGDFDFGGATPSDSLDIDLDGGPTNFAHATAMASALVLIGTHWEVVMGTPGLFSLADLSPGLYGLSFSGSAGLFDGTLTFAAVAAAPIPATLALFVSALCGLGLLGWRKKAA